MKHLVFIIISFLMFQSQASGAGITGRIEYEREFHEVVHLTKSLPIQIQNKFGDILIKTWDKTEVKINAQIKVTAESRPKAKEYAERIRIAIDQRRTNIKIRTYYPRTRPDQVKSASVNYRITLPKGSPVDAKTSFGDIEIEGLENNLSAETSHGEISTSHCRGQTELMDRFGSVKVVGNQGNVAIENSNGSVDVTEIKGDLNIENTFGSITVNIVSGNAKLRNSNGRIRAQRIGGSLEVLNAFGSIILTDIAGDVRVTTSNSAVEIKAADGEVEIHNSFGSVDVEKVGKDLIIDTSNSPIKVANVGGGVSIDDTFGNIEVTGIKGELSIDNSNGTVKVLDVAKDVTVRNSFGNVSVENAGGDVWVDNSNSPIKITNAKGAVEAETSFGPVIVRNVMSDVRVRNQNGNIELSGVKLVESTATGKKTLISRIRLSTSFGLIKLKLPPNPSVSIRAKTTFGKISSDFPLMIEEYRSGTAQSLTGKISDGETIIDLDATNSSIYIREEK